MREGHGPILSEPVSRDLFRPPHSEDRHSALVDPAVVLRMQLLAGRSDASIGNALIEILHHANYNDPAHWRMAYAFKRIGR